MMRNRKWKREYKAKAAAQIEFLENRSRKKDDDVRKLRVELSQMEKLLSCVMDKIGPEVTVRTAEVNKAVPRLIKAEQDDEGMVFTFVKGDQ